MTLTQAQYQSAGATSWPIALTILLWVAWVAVILVADFLGFMMFAFADSPGSASAAKLMIGPMLVWFCVTFLAGIFLLIFKGWWQIPLAFVLAISPPFLAFVGYNLFTPSRVTYSPSSVTTITTPPAPTMNVPPGVFRPPTSATTHPDFQAEVDKWTRATSRPAE